MKSPALSVAEQQKRDGVGDATDGVTVKEMGDSLKFSRPGPFGAYNWTKKKTNLNDVEKAVWEREQKATAPKSSAAPVKD